MSINTNIRRRKSAYNQPRQLNSILKGNCTNQALRCFSWGWQGMCEAYVPSKLLILTHFSTQQTAKEQLIRFYSSSSIVLKLQKEREGSRQ
jgi:hypothetical protein